MQSSTFRASASTSLVGPATKWNDQLPVSESAPGAKEIHLEEPYAIERHQEIQDRHAISLLDEKV